MITPVSPTNASIIDEIFRLFRERGSMLYGESVTERMHGLQCGQLAEAHGCRPALVAASFLHDIGHLVHGMGEDIADRGIDATHEDHGAAWLRPYFPAEVTEPVRMHVDAKRYLARDPVYRSQLSPASEKSLMLQGGPMTDAEAAAFERNPHFGDAVTLRRFDDLGKDPHAPEIDVEHFRRVLEATILPEHARRV